MAVVALWVEEHDDGDWRLYVAQVLLALAVDLEFEVGCHGAYLVLVDVFEHKPGALQPGGMCFLVLRFGVECYCLAQKVCIYDVVAHG